MSEQNIDEATQQQQRFFLGLRGLRLQTAQTWIVILPAYVLFGYNNGAAGPLLNLGPWIDTFPRLDTLSTSGHEKSRNARLQGTVVALYALGAFVGSLSTIFCGDRLGRIRTIQCGALVTIVGAAVSSSAFSLSHLIVGRLALGIGFGAIAATAPNWQSECASAEHRGAAVLYESVFISLGLAVGAWIEFGLSFTTMGSIPEVSWRFPLALPALFAIIVLFFAPLFPESPRWLAKHNRIQEARDALSALYDVPPKSLEVEHAMLEIETSIEATGTISPFSILHYGPDRLLHRTVLAALGQLFQQICGINALAFFLESIFENYLHFSGISARAIAAGAFTWQTLCSPLGVLTVDRFGRRRLMIASALGMGLSMAVVAGAGSGATTSRAAAGTAAAFIFVFQLFFPLGFLGLAFLYAAEVAPLAARVPVTAVSTATAWLFNFAVAEVSPLAQDAIGWRYFVIYAVINVAVIAPTVYFFFPETAGKELEDVDRIFRQSHGIWDPVRVARRMQKARSRGHEKEEGTAMTEGAIVEGGRRGSRKSDETHVEKRKQRMDAE